MLLHIWDRVWGLLCGVFVFFFFFCGSVWYLLQSVTSLESFFFYSKGFHWAFCVLNTAIYCYRSFPSVIRYHPASEVICRSRHTSQASKSVITFKQYSTVIFSNGESGPPARDRWMFIFDLALARLVLVWGGFSCQ